MAVFHLPTQAVTSSSAFPDASRRYKTFFLPDTPKPVGGLGGGPPLWACRRPQVAHPGAWRLRRDLRAREPQKRKSCLCGWSLRRRRLDPGAGPGSSAAATSCPWPSRWPWVRLRQRETSAATVQEMARRQGGERHFRLFWSMEVWGQGVGRSVSPRPPRATSWLCPHMAPPPRACIPDACMSKFPPVIRLPVRRDQGPPRWPHCNLITCFQIQSQTF